MGSPVDFRGRGWSFPPRFDHDIGQVVMVDGDQDIHESLNLLFSTSPGERIMLPDYGCNLVPFLFETFDATVLAHLKTVIEDAVLYHEPRIVLEDVAFDVSDVVEGVLGITLTYVIENTNSRSNYVYPFYLREGTLTRAS
jgi:phage baseplate assembly protein W